MTTFYDTDNNLQEQRQEKKESKFDILEKADHAPISREEEIELFKEYFTPETSEIRREELKIKIVNVNMRFILDYCFNYKNFPIDMNDIVSAAKVGLIIAIDRFDLGRNMKFISFAVWYMKSEVSKLLEKRDMINLPSHKKVMLNRAKKNIDIEDIPDDIRELFELTQPHISFDEPLNPDSDLKVSEVIADPSLSADRNHEKTKCLDLFKESLKSKLNEDELFTIIHIFGLESGEAMGLREVGELMNRSHERIRQLRDSAISKLGKSKDTRLLFEIVQENS